MSHFSIFQLEIQLLYAPLNADKQWKTKSHSSLSSRSVPLSRAMDSAIIILLPFSSSYAGEAHFRKGDGRKGFSLLSTKMHDEQLPRVHSNEKEHHVYFYRDGGESKRGVRSVHYTKVESAIESLLSRKAALYSGSRGENKRYTGVIPLSFRDYFGCSPGSKMRPS